MKTYLLTLSLGAVIAAGCAPSRVAEEGQAPRRQQNVITAEEIPQAHLTRSTHDLIRAMRPNWLQPRGVQSLGSPLEARRGEREPTSTMVHAVAVYVNGSRAGGPEILQQIPARDVQEARFLTATEASSRLGTDHPSGAILITIRGS